MPPHASQMSIFNPSDHMGTAHFNQFKVVEIYRDLTVH